MEHLKSIWRYDPDTGHFYWKISSSGRGPIVPGRQAGCVNDKGYVKLSHREKDYQAHRMAWFFMTGVWPPRELQVEHRNSNKADNRWVNLDLVTRSKNQLNLNDPLRKKNISGCRGVTLATPSKRYPNYQRWRAAITINKRQICLGYFYDLQEAIAARKAAELRLLPADRFPNKKGPLSGAK